jgi:hypothetical protein
VEDARRQGGFSLGLFKDLREVLNFTGTTGCDHQDGLGFPVDMLKGNFSIKTQDCCKIFTLPLLNNPSQKQFGIFLL